MIFNYQFLDTPFCFDAVGALIIENPRLYRQLISHLVSQDIESDFSFIKNGETLKHNQIDFISNPLTLDFTNRKIATALSKLMIATAQSEDFYAVTRTLLQRIDQYALNLTSSLPFTFELECEPVNYEQLIKLLNPKIQVDPLTPLEDLLSYFEVMTEFTNTQLFIIHNLSAFFEKTALFELSHFCQAHEFSVLLIEPHDNPRLNVLSKTMIDSDLCVL